MNKSKPVSIDDVLERHAHAIMEHVDSVIIITTVHNSANNDTELVWEARGNHFANECAVKEWLRNRVNDKPCKEEDNEGWKTR